MTVENVLADAAELIKQNREVTHFRATVTGTSGNLVTIQRTGESSPDDQSYPKLDSYGAPAADDEVIVIQIGSGFIVLGKVVR